MPYIEQERRDEFRAQTGDLVINTPGELNFVLTDIVDDYILETSPECNYAKLNEAIGVLECAKLELYRRVVATYEDRKIAENGDVYFSRL